MTNYDLAAAVNTYMPEIDSLLEEEAVPVFDRLFRASLLFVEFVVVGSSFASKEDLIKSNVFTDCIVPPVNDWYLGKYGELMNRPTEKFYPGLVKLYSQPVQLKIPVTLSTVEKVGETAWLTFPDHLYDNEDIGKMLPERICFDKTQARADVAVVVKYTRSINIAINTATGLDDGARNMSTGIWGHFEKSISDILTFRNERASVGCWELHLAIEKSFKVLLSQKTRKKHTGHDLTELNKSLKEYVPYLNMSPINELPSDREAIRMRYSEQIRTVNEAFEFYKTALLVVYRLTSALERKIRLNNASFLLKKAPWAR